MNLVNEGVLPPNELDDRDERRELAEALLTKPADNVNSGAASDSRDNSGDAAKLREALDESRRIASDLGGCRLNDYWKLNEIVRVCDAALATTSSQSTQEDNQ